MKKSLIYISILILIVTAGAVVFFGKSYFINTQDVAVRLKWKHQAQFAGMYVADSKGFYKREGLNVDLREFDFDVSQIDELVSGEVDFALVSAEEFLLYADQGKDIRAVAAFYQTSPYAIVALANSGIKTPADFLNKTLGTKGGKTEEEIFYLLLLQQFGIAADRVDIKKLGFEKKELDDLLDNDADAVGLYRTDQLYYFDQGLVNYSVIYPEQYGINISNDILITTSKMLDENPDLVRKFIAATVKGWGYAIKNPDQAVDITMQYVVDENYKDSDYEKHILESSIPLIQPTTGQKIGYINPSDFNKLYATMKENNFLKTDFKVADLYTNEFVE